VPSPRYIIAIGLILAWVGSPALACLPSAEMTRAEMECCKKMAGDCQMGNGQHPCCKTITSSPVQTAVVQPSAQVHPELGAVAVVAIALRLSVAEYSGEQALLGLPPPSPPGSISVLRI